MLEASILPHEWIDFCRMSAAIGKDTGLVQGAGGNVSLKENGVLQVKASGKWLCDAEKENIFVPLDLASTSRRTLSGSDDFTSCVLGEARLKPSIETGMHALLPHRVVIHVHSLNALAHAVLEHGDEDLATLLGDIDWRWIPYARPGAPLVKQIYTRIDSASHKPLLLILANHGIVVSADSIENAMDLLNEVEDRLHVNKRVFFVPEDKMPSSPSVRD